MHYSYKLIKYSYLGTFLTYITHSLYLYIRFRWIYNPFYLRSHILYWFVYEFIVSYVKCEICYYILQLYACTFLFYSVQPDDGY